MTTTPTATHRVRWQVWTGFVEHGAHASGHGKCKHPKLQSRDFSNETEARDFAALLRARYGGPEHCPLSIEALVRPPRPSQPALTEVPWPPAVQRLTR